VVELTSLRLSLPATDQMCPPGCRPSTARPASGPLPRPDSPLFGASASLEAVGSSRTGPRPPDPAMAVGDFGEKNRLVWCRRDRTRSGGEREALLIDERISVR